MSTLNKAHATRRIIETADELRLSIAEWYSLSSPTDKDKERLAQKLIPLRYDLEELESGNYDPSRIFQPAPSQDSNQV